MKNLILYFKTTLVLWLIFFTILVFSVGCVEDSAVDSTKHYSTQSAPRISYPEWKIMTVNSFERGMLPTNSGGPIAFCTISPDLPSGLEINPYTCMISGIPTSVSPATSYTVTARNSSGFSTATAGITVKNAIPVIGYRTNSLVLTLGQLVNDLLATNLGGILSSGGCSILPTLPLGLTIDPDNCDITGIPLAPSPLTNYIVTATNALGTATTAINLQVENIAPVISYATNTLTANLNSIISPILTTNSGGAIPAGGCAISPALPTGLNLNPDTCDITGLPTILSGLTNYVVTATNSAGTSTAPLSLVVNNVAPVISYANNILNYSVGSLISALNPTSTGGAIEVGGCSVLPALPPGLSLNPDTCVISGTPLASAVISATNYVVTATNPAGSDTANLNMTINNVLPALNYGVSNLTGNLNSLLSPIVPTNSGGYVSPGGCSISPTLPSGLSFNSSTCAITGTPNIISGLTTYTVQATNSVGTASTSINLLINNIAPALSYTSNVFGLPVGSLISSILPSNSGGAIQSGGCSVTPSLPAGLSLNSNTCEITGIPLPAGISSATNYTVTAINSAGSSSKVLNLAINNVVPRLSYSPNVLTLDLGVLLSSLLPTNTGGAVSPGGCSISPSLPLGLLFNSNTCALTGTPLLSLLPITFTITSSNAMGSSTTTIGLSVLN